MPVLHIYKLHTLLYKAKSFTDLLKYWNSTLKIPSQHGQGITGEICSPKHAEDITLRNMD